MCITLSLFFFLSFPLSLSVYLLYSQDLIDSSIFIYQSIYFLPCIPPMCRLNPNPNPNPNPNR